jgi:hypothetical protein
VIHRPGRGDPGPALALLQGSQSGGSVVGCPDRGFLSGWNSDEELKEPL